MPKHLQKTKHEFWKKRTNKPQLDKKCSELVNRKTAKLLWLQNPNDQTAEILIILGNLKKEREGRGR